MNEIEEALATDIYAALMDSMRESDRSKQAQQFRVGVSDLGFCSERLRRFLDRQEEGETDMLAAFIGTWVGTGVEEAVAKKFPGAITQAELVIELQGDQGSYSIPGHPDIILPDQNILLDGKTTNGLEMAKRSGMDDQQKRFQRHLYGIAAVEAGYLDAEGAQVGNIWVDRSGADHSLYVAIEPLDFNVQHEAAQWLDSVIYAWQNSETAHKEPPREMCRVACGFYEECRGMDTDVEGLLTAPTVLSAVDMQIEAAALEKKAKQLKAQAKDALAGVEGSTGEYVVRWIKVGGSHIDFYRSGYERLSITPLKKGK